jgi:hypothetical protein
MKFSASCAKQSPPLRKPAASCLLEKADAGQQAGKRKTRIDEHSLSSNLPDPLPVLPGESDLVRIYFADLIASVLKDAS